MPGREREYYKPWYRLVTLETLETKIRLWWLYTRCSLELKVHEARGETKKALHSKAYTFPSYKGLGFTVTTDKCDCYHYHG